MTEFTIAEVVGVNDSLQYNASKSSRLFSISVRTISDNLDKIYNDVIPASLNNLQIPLIGEHVVIFEGIHFLDSNNEKIYRWYYLPAYNVQSSINHACSPGVAYDPNNVTNPELLESNQTFTERIIAPMQPYEGDNIYQGRWGNSLRFGSTTSATNAYLPSTWTEGADGDPIIILSNTKTNRPNKEYVVENYGDYSGLWLSSTQRFNGFKLHYNLKESTGKDSTNTTNVSQFFGIADRVILHAKSDVVALDSQRAIEMRAPKLVIGPDGDKYGLVDTKQLQLILNKMVDLITLGLRARKQVSVAPNDLGESIAGELDTLILNLANDQILIIEKSNDPELVT